MKKLLLITALLITLVSCTKEKERPADLLVGEWSVAENVEGLPTAYYTAEIIAISYNSVHLKIDYTVKPQHYLLTPIVTVNNNELFYQGSALNGTVKEYKLIDLVYYNNMTRVEQTWIRL